MNTLMMVVFVSIDMMYSSTYLYLLQFLYIVSYNFPSTGLLHPWLRYYSLVLYVRIPRYYIFLCNCKWDGFLSSPESSLCMYINATDFLIFILHLVTLLNSVTRITSLLVESLQFSIYTITSSSHTQACLLKPCVCGLRGGVLDAGGCSTCLALHPLQQLLSFPHPYGP
ncbi:hypothetical protein HJG60_009742 [Phyllostomus discolor]|uniref:Uncharacterized protein n=1 Tax=Phyllostomus discolor TaxID=89673 RepID=A0A834BC44_9CHIR|nr:hypothetical protein HJG60_009742 [Phyllostomus discolor]